MGLGLVQGTMGLVHDLWHKLRNLSEDRTGQAEKTGVLIPGKED